MQQHRAKVETNVGKTALVGRRRNGQYVNASAEASTRLGQRTLSFQRGRGLLGDGTWPCCSTERVYNHGIPAHDSRTRPAKDPCVLGAVFLEVTGRVLQQRCQVKTSRIRVHSRGAGGDDMEIRIQPASSVRPVPRPGRETAPDLACDTAKPDRLT